MFSFKKRSRFIAGLGRLTLSTFLLSTTQLTAIMASAPANAQTAARSFRFAIPAQPLSQALVRFSQVSGVDVVFDGSLPAGGRTGGISGELTPRQAIEALLAGTGLSWRFSGANTVVLGAAAGGREGAAFQPTDGATVLDVITVSGKSGRAAAEAPYETAAPVAHISSETIDRFRGASPADMFRGTAGVMSGEARNGAGAIDVNIRGMQGMGRVATTVDGAENSVTVYQGYQGISNRTYVDPDFIAGVDITKGADASSFGNAGSVAMRTVGADDIVKEGETWGLRVKGGFGTNTSVPHAGDISGYQYKSGDGVAIPSASGMDRPAILKPTSGSGSVVGAYKGENIDFLAGYAHRRQGNYHAGSKGPVADPVNIGDTPNGWGGTQKNTMVNRGLVNYRAGEEVLNTELETQSWLAKVTARFADDHTLQLGYMGYKSEAGDRLASRQTSSVSQAQQQPLTSGTRLDTVTARYRWNPEDNDLIDFSTNLYWNHLQLRNPVRGGRNVTAEGIGLPGSFRIGSDTDMWGAEITNLSKFSFDLGDLDLTYGLSYRAEDTRGSLHTGVLEGWLTPRDAIRHEAAGFFKAAYKPVDWATINSGLRYSRYWLEDRYDPYESWQSNGKLMGYTTDDGGFSPSVGITLEPFEGAQVYLNYSNAMRSPSIIESVNAFNSVSVNTSVTPERSSNWEAGVNLRGDGLLAADDSAMLKFGYFNWDVKNYIARNLVVDPNGSGLQALNIANIHRAKFSGLELSARYEVEGFAADLSANYFLGVEYCRTAETCGNSTLYGDYATNQVQPEYTVNLTLSQKLLEDRLTLGGRISHTGPRAAGHGDVTAQGASQFISMVDWKPYTLVDLFGEYKISDNLTASIRVENLFDRFYLDPLGLVTQPGPGRTIYASLTSSFGGDQSLPALPAFFGGNREEAEEGRLDWTGLYAGANLGWSLAGIKGTTTTLDGTADAIAATESADLTLTAPEIGGQIGFNHQFSNGFILGVEADYSKTWMNGSQDAMSTKVWQGTTGIAGRGLQAQTNYEIDWSTSLKGRVGFAVDKRLMVYGTAGLALLKETEWRSQYQIETGYTSGAGTEIMFIDKASATRTGLTIGGGMEYALNDRWSVRADYSYSRFKARDFNFASARAGLERDYKALEQVGTQWITPDFGELCAIYPVICTPYEAPVYKEVDKQGSPTNGRQASNTLNLHSFKVGLNYRF